MKAILISTKVLINFEAGDKLNLLNNSSGHAVIIAQKRQLTVSRGKNKE